jgi:Arc/MetJ family transcription regulator
MRKTTLVINEELLAEVRAILGTRGIKDTIDAALSEIVKQEARREAFEQLRTMDGLDLDRDEVLARAWR